MKKSKIYLFMLIVVMAISTLCMTSCGIDETYTITWKNGEAVLETDSEVAVGATPSYDGETPTKTATSEFTYS